MARERRPRTLIVLGPQGAGKKMTAGSVLFKSDSVNMEMMNFFQSNGIVANDKAAKALMDTGKLNFGTLNVHFQVLDKNSKEADCYLVVLAAETLLDENVPAYALPPDLEKTIIVINKMDEIDWSEEKFDKIVENLRQVTPSSVIIPISASSGDNVLEKSPKSTWYRGWERNGATGMTLLGALDATL